MKKAFTMIELIMVIVVAGILAAVALPKLGETSLHEAVDQIVSHIRYTQHLAMQDDKFDPSDADWYKGRWQILFNKDANTNQRWAYTIYSDLSHTGNPDPNEVAKNPQNQEQLLTGGFSGAINADSKEATKRLNIGKKYGIKSVVFANNCSTPTSVAGKRSTRLAFDNYGRPLYGRLSSFADPYGTATQNRLIQTRCEILICTTDPCPAADGDTRRTIVVEPETGYVHVKPI